MSLHGQQLGRYQLLHLLGAGGMGEVYLAEDTRIARQIAIKVIKSDVMPYPDTTTAQEVNRLFLREAKAIATLQHPHILPLFDYGEDIVHGNTLSYMVMPYCQEGSLDVWLRRRGSVYLPSLQDIAQFLNKLQMRSTMPTSSILFIKMSNSQIFLFVIGKHLISPIFSSQISALPSLFLQIRVPVNLFAALRHTWHQNSGKVIQFRQRTSMRLPL